MMRNVLLILTGVILFTACKKYPDGPLISLMPKKERLEGKWIAESVMLNSLDSTQQYKALVWEFTRHGSVILQNGKLKTTGVWSMVTNNEDLRIDYDDNSTVLYRILRLKTKELWLRNKQTQVTFKLKPQ